MQKASLTSEQKPRPSDSSRLFTWISDKEANYCQLSVSYEKQACFKFNKQLS